MMKLDTCSFSQRLYFYNHVDVMVRKSYFETVTGTPSNVWSQLLRWNCHFMDVCVKKARFKCVFTMGLSFSL